jgi:glycosyltransferase involved in cell wall biosynthesis
MTVSLCLLVWNELEGCKIDVPHLPRDQFEEIYAIDGGSTDGTSEYLEAMGIPVYGQTKRGLNAAYHAAYERSHCDALVVFFPKGTTPPEDVLKFRPLFEAGCALVVASRNIRGARNEEDGSWFKPRKWSVLSLALLTAAIWRREGRLIRDILHGFKGFTREGFARMNPSDQGLSIDLELAVRSYRLRLKRAEFPTREVVRAHGQTRFKAIPTGKKLLGFLWAELRRDVNPPGG